MPAGTGTGTGAGRRDAEGVDVVCLGRVLTDGEARAVASPAGAERACRWVRARELDGHVPPHQARRVRHALVAADRGNELPLLLLGEPTPGRRCLG